MPQAGEQDPVVTGRDNPNITVDFLAVNQGASLTNQATAPATPSGGAVVYAQNGVPLFKDSSGNVTTLKNSDPVASDSALAAWAFDPAGAAAAFLTTAGVLYLSKVILTQQQTLTNGLVSVTTAGGTLTAAENYLALFNSAGVQVAISADQTTAFATAGLITAAWTSPLVNAAPGAYYVGVLCNGGTAITLASGSALKPGNVSVGNAGLATAASRFLTSGTSQTAMPSSVALGSASGNVAATIWAAVS
ncbi:hypothetical protein [Streptacidiphilus sp. EB129]|uniref:hypothetical protein n=1 Tax=Streptacidiphilus sp. EB129 TaxID=3156262 RepID=UPI0035113ACC